MKSFEPQPQMSTYRFITFVSLLLFAVASIAYLMITYHTKVDTTQSINASGIFVTLLTVTTIELVPEFQRQWSKGRRRGKFGQFFGPAAVKNNVRLVFSHRKLKPSHMHDAWTTTETYPRPEERTEYSLHTIKQQMSTVFEQIRARVMNTAREPEGINSWLAYQEIRASVYLANEVFRMTGREIEFIHDDKLSGTSSKYCDISMGLGFNAFTNHLAQEFNGRLFEIIWGESPKPNFKKKTDLFGIGEKLPYIPPKGADDCIVARIVLDTAPKTICFVCAGRTANGTAVAGYFLAKNWEELMQRYKIKNKNLDKDSMVAVVRHPSAESGPKEPGYNFDDRGKIAIEGEGEGIGEVVMFWLDEGRTKKFDSLDEWKKWLEVNHSTSTGLWLKIVRKDLGIDVASPQWLQSALRRLKMAKKESGVASVSYADALSVALSYGWVDGQKDKLDDEFWLVLFTPRESRSKWSKINCAKARELIKEGKMKPAGLDEVDRAVADGRWEAAYDGRRAATVPKDLQRALDKDKNAREFFATLDRLNRYTILFEIYDAEKLKPRAHLIRKYVEMLNKEQKIHPPRPPLGAILGF